MSDEIKKLIEDDIAATKSLREKVDALESKYDGVTNDEIKKLETAVAEITADRQKAEQTVSELKAKLDELEVASNRPGGQKGVGDKAVAEHKAAFEQFMRKGEEDGLSDLEAKAMSIGTDADGGYAIPEELDRDISKLLVDLSPMRGLARVITVSGENYKKLFNTGGTGSGWVGETAARPETNTPTLTELTPSMGEIYANPAATQRSLDDVMFDVEAFLSAEVQEEFAVQEGAAFISGNGTNKPIGILAGATAATADASRAFGTIEHVATGVSGDFAASDKGDIMYDLIYKMKSGHRGSASWVMNSTTTAQVRKLKDGQGNYLWQPSFQAGQPATLAGYGVTTDENMPDIAADSLSIMFGNYRAAYYIVDRMGTRVLRDPFTNKPYVHFYTTKRVGGMLADSEAVKVVKFGLA